MIHLFLRSLASVFGILLLTAACTAGEAMDRVTELEDKFGQALSRGEIATALNLGQEVNKAAQDAGIPEESWRHRNHLQVMGDLEQIIMLPAKTLQIVSQGIRLTDADNKNWDAENRERSLKELESGYAILDEHLPMSSAIRLERAGTLFRHLRTIKPEREIRSSVEEHYRVSRDRFGPKFHMTIEFEMELALLDILGKDPTLGYNKMQELLFSDDPEMDDSHFPTRLFYYNEFMFTLSIAGHDEWLQANSKKVLQLYSPYVHNRSACSRFISSARLCIVSYRESSDWLPVAEISRFILAHKIIQSPEYRDTRLIFLEYRLEALRKLGEHDEADLVAAQIAKAELEDPRRKSRYTEE